ncbi:MAG: SH3 domain-containing protein, partial [Chloroflexales bacterium]|nr:SH3 domain-containing protein [Chloroflexales bacterium]
LDPSPPPSLVANVFNGGNLREQPGIQGRVLDQINAGERVELRAKNAQGTWYQVVNQRGTQGWVSATLLSIAPQTASEVSSVP